MRRESRKLLAEKGGEVEKQNPRKADSSGDAQCRFSRCGKRARTLTLRCLTFAHFARVYFFNFPRTKTSGESRGSGNSARARARERERERVRRGDSQIEFHAWEMRFRRRRAMKRDAFDRVRRLGFGRSQGRAIAECAARSRLSFDIRG